MNLFPSFQESLVGKSAGDTFEVTLSTENAAGPVDVAKIFVVSRSELEESGLDLAELAVGDEVEDLYMETSGSSLDGRIIEVTETAAKVDTNQPLAGMTCTYTGEILEVTDAKPPFPPSFVHDVEAYAETTLQATEARFALDPGLGHFARGHHDREHKRLRLCGLNPATDEYDRDVLSAEAELIGTQDQWGSEASVFRWVWSLDGNKLANDRIARVRDYGRKNGITSLSSETCTTADYDEVLFLVRAAAFITDAIGVYSLAAAELGLDDPNEGSPTYYFALYDVKVIDQAAFNDIAGNQ